MASNKEAAISFLTLAAAGRAREAFATYGGPGFRHHNPWFKGDADSLAAAWDLAQEVPPESPNAHGMF